MLQILNVKYFFAVGSLVAFDEKKTKNNSYRKRDFTSLAVLSCVATDTVASISIDSIDTCGSILARDARTFINV